MAKYCHYCHLEFDLEGNDNGIYSCPTCLKDGNIVDTGPEDENIFDTGPEWRAFDMQQENALARAGPPMQTTLPDMGLSTEISPTNRDYYGRSISNRNQSMLFRMRKWQRRGRASKSAERNMAVAMREMQTVATNLKLPRRIQETAAFIYRRATQEQSLSGRAIERVVCAALYAACRQESVPRTLTEISQHSRYSRKEISRTYQVMVKMHSMPPLPEDYLPRICSKLELSPKVEGAARDLLRAAQDVPLTNSVPISLAAAAVYIASIVNNERRKQKDVARAADLTEVTIRSRYKEMAQFLNIDIHI
jgi:transcription initiation factor TFIIB